MLNCSWLKAAGLETVKGMRHIGARVDILHGGSDIRSNDRIAAAGNRIDCQAPVCRIPDQLKRTGCKRRIRPLRRRQVHTGATRVLEIKQRHIPTAGLGNIKRRDGIRCPAQTIVLGREHLAALGQGQFKAIVAVDVERPVPRGWNGHDAGGLNQEIIDFHADGLRGEGHFAAGKIAAAASAHVVDDGGVGVHDGGF